MLLIILLNKKFLLGQSWDSFPAFLDVTMHQLFVLEQAIDNLTT